MSVFVPVIALLPITRQTRTNQVPYPFCQQVWTLSESWQREYQQFLNVYKANFMLQLFARVEETK